MKWYDDLRKRSDALFETYGRIALGTYVTLCVTMFGGIWVALNLGMEVESAAGGAGTFGAAYVTYKLLWPVRIVAALLLTPAIAWVLRSRASSESPR